MQRFIGHFENLLQSIVTDPEIPVSVLPILQASGRQNILEKLNQLSAPNQLSSMDQFLLAEANGERDRKSLSVGCCDDL